MKPFFIAFKCGMTRFFTKEGVSIPVTVIKVYYNYVVYVNPLNNDCCSVKLSTGEVKEDKISKSLYAFYKSIGLKCMKHMCEFRIKKKDLKDYHVGNKISVSIFNTSDKIDVTGTSKGKGFSGVIKRHNFSSQRATHGNSLSHRAPGSIGQCQSPGKVFKGKKMPGRMGHSKTTVRNVEIVSIYSDLNAILLKGSIPGVLGGKVLLKKKC